METNDNCDHYQRKCLLLAPCCGKVYSCRLCHDDVESHNLVRQNVDTIVCSQCKESQKVSKNCSGCGILFGKYSCLVCRLFDDRERSQFHCEQCGICRVGGRENFFHCTKCNMCLGLAIKESHNCVEDASKTNCPACLEDIHTSRKKVHVPKCSHLMHMECYEAMIRHNTYACPVCNQSLLDMSEYWKHIDTAVEETIMPQIYQEYHVNILCRDCQGKSRVKFHVVGLKCQDCGSYNTTRIGGDDPLPSDTTNSLQELVEGLNAAIEEGEEDEGWETISEEGESSGGNEAEDNDRNESENVRYSPTDVGAGANSTLSSTENEEESKENHEGNRSSLIDEPTVRIRVEDT